MQCVQFDLQCPSLTFEEASLDSAIMIQGKGLWSLNSSLCLAIRLNHYNGIMGLN